MHLTLYSLFRSKYGSINTKNILTTQSLSISLYFACSDATVDIAILIPQYINVNNPSNTITIKTDVLFKMKYNVNSLPYYPIKELPMYDDEEYFVRAPRLRRFISTYDISITPPR